MTGPVTFQQDYELLSFCCRVVSDLDGIAPLLGPFLASFEVPTSAELSDSTYLITPGAEPVGGISLFLGADEKVRGGTIIDAIEFLLWEVSQEAIASIDGKLGLHAGAVAAHRSGLVLPAPSGSGKSTLTAGLTAAGCEYLSDELALIDLTSGVLHPFPRALWMSQTSIDFLPGLAERLPVELAADDRIERHVPPDALRPDPVGASCPV
ncbi:MAG: hypothetical protein ACRDZP_09665, partial [Acidimicrobiales bacterium]